MPLERGLCDMPRKSAGECVSQSDFHGIGNQIGKHTSCCNQPKSAAGVQVKPQAAAQIADKLTRDHGGELTEPFQQTVDKGRKQKPPEISTGNTGQHTDTAMKTAENRKPHSTQQQIDHHGDAAALSTKKAKGKKNAKGL